MENPVLRGFVQRRQRSVESTEPRPVVAPALSTNRPKPKLLDQVRQAIRARHYSSRTEEAYVAWIQGVK